MRRGSRFHESAIFIALFAAILWRLPALAIELTPSWRSDIPGVSANEMLTGTVCDDGSAAIIGNGRLIRLAPDGHLVFHRRVKNIDAVSCRQNGDLLIARSGEITIERVSSPQPPVVLRRTPSRIAALGIASTGETTAVVAGRDDRNGLPLHLVNLITGRTDSFGEGSPHPRMWDAATAAGALLVDPALRRIVFLPHVIPEFQIYDTRGNRIDVEPLEHGPYDPAAWQDSVESPHPLSIEGAAFLRDHQTMLLQVRFDRRPAASAYCAEFSAKFRRLSEYEPCPQGRLIGSDGRREVVFLAPHHISAFHVTGETPNRKAPRREEPPLRSIRSAR